MTKAKKSKMAATANWKAALAEGRVVKTVLDDGSDDYSLWSYPTVKAAHDAIAEARMMGFEAYVLSSVMLHIDDSSCYIPFEKRPKNLA